MNSIGQIRFVGEIICRRGLLPAAAALLSPDFTHGLVWYAFFGENASKTTGNRYFWSAHKLKQLGAGCGIPAFTNRWIG
jgi:hypothetical protein